MAINKAHRIGTASCVSCTYGRRTDGVCDIHGTDVTANKICRTYRTPGQSHQESRSANALIEKLRPGYVYQIAAEKSNASRKSIHALSRMVPIPRNEPSSELGDNLVDSFQFLVRNIDGSNSPARIDCYEHGLFILVMADIRYSNKTANDAFHALQEIRMEMEVDGRIPLVNGANRHAIVSGMAIDMGGGYVVYLANQSHDKEMVTAPTFGTDFVTDPVYVDAQKSYKQHWINQTQQFHTSRSVKQFNFDAAYGAIVGALAGDAAGATLEFLGRKPTSEEVDAAMSMIGGGAWKTAPGQITDDGELTLALLHALSKSNAYDPDRVAQWYRRWYLSKPFDVGMATTNALRYGDLDSPDLAQTIMANANKANLASKANGGLMRISALGAWSANVELDQAIEAAMMDAQLTHPNLSCQWANAAYVIAIRHLTLNSGDAQGAFKLAEDALSAKGAEEVLGWIRDAKNGVLPEFHPSAGFVRIGFTHAFYHLVQEHSYETSIAQTLSGGGDTDTNACIVGGLIGALHGGNSIPMLMQKRLLECNTQLGRPRPEWLHTTKLNELVSNLFPTDMDCTKG